MVWDGTSHSACTEFCRLLADSWRWVTTTSLANNKRSQVAIAEPMLASYDKEHQWVFRDSIHDGSTIIFGV